jgi:hypothetical protein
MPEITPNLASDRRIARIAGPVRNFVMTTGQVKRVQGFSLQWLFPIDSPMRLK